MFNGTIFMQTLKDNLKLWLIFTAVTGIVLAVMIAVFEPATISGVTDLVKDTPLADIVRDTTFTGMIASTFYTLHGILLPVIYIIMTANSLIAAKIDRGSMVWLLSTPVRRSAVVGTQALYLAAALAVMFIVLTACGLAAMYAFQRDIADESVRDFLMLNLGLFLLLFATGGISFFFSCLFNLSRHSLALGAGIPIAFFIFKLLAQVSSSLEGLKYFTINTLFDVDAIIGGERMIIPFLVLLAIGLVLYPAGMRVFQQKDLPL